MEDAPNIIPADPGNAPSDDLAPIAPIAPPEPPMLPPEILAAVPAGPEISHEELVEQLGESRIRVLRIGGVALETIGTIAAAFLIEAAFFTAGYFLVITGAHWLHSPQPDGFAHTYFSVETIDDGGSGTGGAPQGTAALTGNPEIAGQGPIAIIGKRPNAAGLQLPIPNSSGESAPAQPNSLLPDEMPLIAFGSATSADAPKAKIPHPGISSARPADQGPSVDQVNGTVALASAGGNSSRAVANTLGPDDGGGDDYAITDFVKPGKGGGIGNGSGRGRGNGTDRGPSIANHDQPAVLESPRIELPEHIRRGFVWIKGGVVFQVTVEPDGKPSSIKLTKSSGNAEVDALMKSYISATKFRPAYRAGHPITATMDMSFFSDIDE